MDAMEYKGYRGAVRYSADDRILHGRILGIDDVVNFEGADVDELERAFHEAVDDYLALCEKLGRAPEREYSGKIPLRIEADLHRRVAIAADSEAKSVNRWIADTLAAAAEVKRVAPRANMSRVAIRKGPKRKVKARARARRA
jgi:predicted HicB family RNase H-like nuclease